MPLWPKSRVTRRFVRRQLVKPAFGHVEKLAAFLGRESDGDRIDGLGGIYETVAPPLLI